MARLIENFEPEIKPEYWAAIEEFVRHAVYDAEPARRDTAYNWLQTSTRLVLWCWQSEGLPLDRAVVYDSATIDRYVAQMTNRPDYSKGTERSRLKAVAERLLGRQANSGEYRAYPRSAAPRPYSVAELIALRGLANGQRTHYQRTNLKVLIALGAGAGVAGGEMTALRSEDLARSDGGFLVTVRGKGVRTRTVPITEEWEDLVEEVWDDVMAGEYLFLARRTTVDVSNTALAALCKRTSAHGVRAESRRLRSTWLCAHLEAGTHLSVLMSAAGLGTCANLERYLPFVQGPAQQVSDEILRLRGEQS